MCILETIFPGLGKNRKFETIMNKFLLLENLNIDETGTFAAISNLHQLENLYGVFFSGVLRANRGGICDVRKVELK